MMVITSGNSYAVGNLFIKSLQHLGHDVKPFDVFNVLSKYVRGGFVGRKVNNFWPVEAWSRKANRELAVFIQQYKPDYVLISGDNPVQVSTIAFAKSILPDLKVILFWPDTLINLSSAIISLSPMIDILASYSNTAIDQFKLLGFKQCVWMPFAGDTEFLTDKSVEIFSDGFEFDCSFIGGWRPEREEVLGKIIQLLPDISLRIVGPLWNKKVKNRALLKYIDNSPKFGKEFGSFIRSSRINLNIIDDTNYPAANMRFFEIPAAGGLQLTSSCPEMYHQFVDGEHLFYFDSPETVVEKIKYILSQPEIAAQVRRKGHAFIQEQHTYIHRMKLIL